MVLVVEPQYNYMIIDHVMHFLYALHALPLAFHALSSIVVEVETTPCFHAFTTPLFKKRGGERGELSYSSVVPIFCHIETDFGNR